MRKLIAVLIKMCIFAVEMKKIVSVVLMFMLLLPVVAVAKVRTRTWVIDAGHGGRDVGCEGSKTKEKYITLSVAKRVAELVRANISGVKVKMTRETDTFLTLEQRAHIANNAGADLFLSIHVNAAPEVNNIRGTETYYGPVGATNNSDVEYARRTNIRKSELLAWELQKNYGMVGRPISRGVKRERYYVLLYTRMPSVLTEIGFISTPSEQDYMMSPAGQEEIAQCIYRGLRDYKKAVDAGREKRELAEMRRTGGKVKKKEEPKVETPADVNTTAATTDLAQADPKQEEKQPVITAEDIKAEASVVLDSSLEPEFESGDLHFYIQIFALKSKIKMPDPRFKGLKDIEILQKDEKYKYLYGKTSDYQQARKTLLDVRKLFPDAFLVAFLGNRQISTSDAQELYIKSK